MPDLTIHYDRGGVHLPDPGLWLDPHQFEASTARGKVLIVPPQSNRDNLAREIGPPAR